MIPSAAKPIVRREVDQLLEAESLNRLDIDPLPATTSSVMPMIRLMSGVIALRVAEARRTSRRCRKHLFRHR